jgi:hypothetical protein
MLEDQLFFWLYSFAIHVVHSMLNIKSLGYGNISFLIIFLNLMKHYMQDSEIAILKMC